MENFRNHPLYRRHTFDSAMGAVWNFYKKNFLSLYLISLVMSLVLQYLTTSFLKTDQLQSTTDLQEMIGIMQEMLVPMLLISIVSLFFTTVLQYYILHKPVDENAGILASVIGGFKYFFPFLIIMILLAFFGTFAIVIGLLALIIGALFVAVYLMTLYLFILPVLMIEGSNIGNAISRSFKLTHKDFWANIGMAAVFLITIIVISMIISAIVMIPFSGSVLKSAFNPGETATNDLLTSPFFLIFSAALSALTLPLVPIFACTLYFKARAEEEYEQNAGAKLEEYKPRVEDLYSGPTGSPDNTSIENNPEIK
ncbi:MAG TPA: glycerophosphoryl diester phosphodiesterase membrane domain-containing protein [Bacteroidales bacterium]|nr:glycerophosphoryl diester phosphodiesterase membrane domain-containing protein [Bacteroidales bacterium]